MLWKYLIYSTLWSGVVALSWISYRRGLAVGGTAAWAGILHPLLFGVTLWRVVRRFVRGEGWLTVPGAVLGLTYVVMGLGSVYFVFHVDALSYAPLKQPEHVREGLLLVLLGVVTYRVGVGCLRSVDMASVIGEFRPAPSWSPGVRVGAYTAIGFALAIRIHLVATGAIGFSSQPEAVQVGGFQSILSFLSKAGLFGLSGLYFYWFRSASFSRWDKLFTIAVTLVLAGVGLLSGMKKQFLIIIVSIAIPYMWTRRNIGSVRKERIKQFVLVIAFLTVMAFVFALNPMYRTALARTADHGDRVAEAEAAMTTVIRQVRSDPERVLSLVSDGTERIWARFSMFSYLLAVIDQVPETKTYRGVGRYLELPAMAFIPRAAWPGKPVNTSPTEFQASFVSAEAVFSTTPTVFGWGYWDMGVPGLVVVMLSLGGVAGILEGWLAERQRTRLGAVLLYTALFSALATVQADPFWLLGGLPKLAVVALVVYAFFRIAPACAGRSSTIQRGAEPRGQSGSGHEIR